MGCWILDFFYLIFKYYSIKSISKAKNTTKFNNQTEIIHVAGEIITATIQHGDPICALKKFRGISDF